MKVTTLIAALAVAGLATTATAAEWQVADGTSTVEFAAVQQGTKFTGRFETFSAMIDIDPANVTAGSITGIVETASVNTRDHDRDASLNDRDWFDTATYPEATFASESIAAEGDGYVASGTLTIKGTSKPAQMPFTFAAGADGTATFNGTLTVDRFQFNVGEGWNDTSWVGQDVDVEIELDLTR